MHPSLFYLPGERLSLAELGAARLDGDVVEVGEGYMPADTVEGPAARAASVASLLAERTAACGATAAWIHGAGDRPPSPHHVRRTSARRFRPALAPHVIFHEVRVPSEDVALVSGVPVVAPLPTAMELLFRAALDDRSGPQRRAGTDARDAERWLRDLLTALPELAALAEQRLAIVPRRPGRRRAERLLERMRCAQDVVTR